MAIPIRLRPGSAVLGAAYAGLLFFHGRTRVSQVLPSPPAPAVRQGHPPRLGALRITRAAIIAAALTAATLPAQAQFTSLTGFGDSYADTGAAPGGAFRLLLGIPCPNNSALPTCRWTGSTNFVDTLRSIYGLPGLTNYSIGGARTDNSNTLSGLDGPPPNYGFPYELQQFATSGTHFTKTDLIALSIGGNDMSAIDLRGLTTDAQKTALIESSAATSAKSAVAGVQQLVGAGARNIAWLSTGSSRYFPEPPNFVLPDRSVAVPFTTDQRDAWANTYYQQTQQLLAPLARSGVRIFLFDFGILQDRVSTNPGLYGFSSALNCEAGPPNTASPPYTPASVRTNFTGCFYENSVHPTGPAMALIATYMANQIDAPTTVVPQGSIATSLASGFSTSVLGRLDAQRGLPARAEGYKDGGAESPWSVYGNVNYGSGNLNVSFSPQATITTPSAAWSGPNTGSIPGCCSEACSDTRPRQSAAGSRTPKTTSIPINSPAIARSRARTCSPMLSSLMAVTTTLSTARA